MIKCHVFMKETKIIINKSKPLKLLEINKNIKLFNYDLMKKINI